ncbi:hypothetical protein V6Z12_A01G119900 [Gossypium hirsutum]|uniref:PARP catalytic domain-containing protein n=1 Tax=Gossypium darwinii TaxID=34276 RepID=A0A5D2HKS7_GOSDA|nr:hypothetical protein ES288_A01G123400v1 [Gossypium darwinii]
MGRRHGPCRGQQDPITAPPPRLLQELFNSGSFLGVMNVIRSLTLAGIHRQEQASVPAHSAERCSQKLKAWNFIKQFAMQSFVGLVSELGPEDSGRNIVEIIFKSSWLKKDNPICKIERILKVHNNQRTIQRFEDCRDAVKTRALNSTRKNPRCAADGNELLRFHCTTLSCSLGARGSSSLCGSIPGCGVCTIIRQGFQNKGEGTAPAAEFKGVVTTASSGRAHDSIKRTDGRRAMLVCRVIAGRVKRVADEAPPLEDENSSGVSSSAGSYDSVAAYAGVYSNLEELVVFNPRAILPCFVVIYKALESGVI